jgi:hypothetical protein
MDILNDFIWELYEDGTVDRWKRKRACDGESPEAKLTRESAFTPRYLRHP